LTRYCVQCLTLALELRFPCKILFAWSVYLIVEICSNLLKSFGL